LIASEPFTDIGVDWGKIMALGSLSASPTAVGPGIARLSPVIDLTCIDSKKSVNIPHSMHRQRGEWIKEP